MPHTLYISAGNCEFSTEISTFSLVRKSHDVGTAGSVEGGLKRRLRLGSNRAAVISDTFAIDR